MLENDHTSHKSKKVAIVHDALCVSGGAERLALEMVKSFPEAAFFTSVYLSEQTFSDFKNINIRTLPGSKLIKTDKQFKLSYPFWLLALRNQDFRGFDVVLSSSTYLAKFINPEKVIEHKAYIYAPFRFLWTPSSYTQDSLPTSPIVTRLIKMFFNPLKKMDLKETKKIKHIATSCQNMAQAIDRIYHKSAEVIYPPIDLNKYQISDNPGDYYLSVSRLISHKRIDLAVAACNKLKKNLVVVGDGPERSRLEKMAGNSIRFIGRANDEELIELYKNSKALLFPSHEDFGIVPLEAQACGKPVLAYGKGGVLETVITGETGLFFQDQTVDSIIDCIQKFKSLAFNPITIRAHVGKFDIPNFNNRIRDFVLC